MKLDINQLKDVAERALMTYAQSVIGLWVAGSMTDMSLSSVKTLAVSAAPGALSIIKSYLATALPFGDASASVLKTTPAPASSGLHE